MQTTSARHENRDSQELRPHSFTLDYAPYAEGSVLIATGNTRVLCTATVEENVPSWLMEKNKGWVTAEYSMLPRATQIRGKREQNRTSGRTQEIQRLIGRSLRAVTELSVLEKRRILIDCDVIQADAGTRTASVTGSWIALALACDKLVREGKISRWPLLDQVAAVSIGCLEDRVLLDLDYTEDSAADVDLNLVMTGKGRLVEVQGCGEEATFDRAQLDAMLDVGWLGLEKLFEMQRAALRSKGIHRHG